MKFVKVKSGNKPFPSWFMVIDSQPSIEFIESMKERMVTGAIHRMVKGGDGHPGVGFMPGLVDKCYKDPLWATDRSKTWLLKENCGFMELSDGMTITDEYHGDSYPTGDAEVIICENDPENEHLDTFWKRHLKGRSAYSVNNFRHRSLEEVVSYFNTCKTIAFHTTFTSFDWWELLIEAWNLSITKPNVIGYCGNDESWEQAQGMAPFQVTRLRFAPSLSPAF